VTFNSIFAIRNKCFKSCHKIGRSNCLTKSATSKAE
jgi:hypothetical protein